MARDTGIRVEGAAELRRTLKRAGDDLSDLKDAHREAANIVTVASRVKAPKRTGQLAASVRGSGAATTATIRAGRSSVPYAGPIHWGWPARGIPANPFITEAARATEPVWTHGYEAAVEKILHRIKGI